MSDDPWHEPHTSCKRTSTTLITERSTIHLKRGRSGLPKELNVSHDTLSYNLMLQFDCRSYPKAALVDCHVESKEHGHVMRLERDSACDLVRVVWLIAGGSKAMTAPKDFKLGMVPLFDSIVFLGERIYFMDVDAMTRKQLYRLHKSEHPQTEMSALLGVLQVENFMTCSHRLHVTVNRETLFDEYYDPSVITLEYVKAKMACLAHVIDGGGLLGPAIELAWSVTVATEVE